MASSSPSPPSIANGNPSPNPFDRHALFRPPAPPAISSSFYSAPPATSSTSAPPFVFPSQAQQSFLYPSPPQQPPLYSPQPLLYAPQQPPPFPVHQQNSHGAHIMTLLGGSPSAPPVPSSGEFTSLFSAAQQQQPQVQAQQLPSPARMGSRKVARGRSLSTTEPRVVYDIDVRLPGEPNPQQLEVTPITKYVSDPGLVLGRQIAVNKTYICYGLKLGAIRVLNINTALRALFKGHGQRVSDMVFFAQDVHLLASASVDGKVFVWKIDEDPDVSEKPLITEKVLLAIQISTDHKSVHPRICWHRHKQEILVIGIGNTILKIDIHKVRKEDQCLAEKPLKFHIETLIDGVEYIGNHDAEVTDLSMCQWMTTRLASASKDGTIKIWEDRKPDPLVIIRPYDGQPVNSVAFLTTPHRPDHIVLLTAGPLNREVKIWVSASNEGWLLPTDSESWYCTQTLDLQSSSLPHYEDAFFNQVVVLPHANLILLANAKKNAIYAVHVDYGPAPASTRMDYITEFTVTMPILSLTATFDIIPDGEQFVQVYCVQTHAIQQYALDLFQCLPPALEKASLGRESSTPNVFEGPKSAVLSVYDPSTVIFESEVAATNASPNQQHVASAVVAGSSSHLSSGNSESSFQEDQHNTKVEIAPSNSGVNNIPVHLVSGTPEVSGKLSASVYSSKASEQVLQDNHTTNEGFRIQTSGKIEDDMKDLSNVAPASASMIPEDSHSHIEKVTLAQNFNVSATVSTVPHLITPSEILSGAVRSSENINSILDPKMQERASVNVSNSSSSRNEHEANMTGVSVERVSIKDEETSGVKSPGANAGSIVEHSATKTDVCNENESPLVQIVVSGTTEESLDAFGESHQEFKNMRNTDSEKIDAKEETHSPPLAEAKMHNGTSYSCSSPKGNRLYNNQENALFCIEPILSRITALEETMSQILGMQNEMQKNMTATLAIPVAKEGKRIETSLGRNMEKSVKANCDALWARIQEENAKREKLEREQIQHLSTIITNCMIKEVPALFEKSIKKEFSALGPSIARAITPVIEKTLITTVAENFQRAIGDKPLAQLEKSVNSKLEGTITRHIQTQFQTSGKQVLQEALRTTLEASVIPAFEQSCRSMFEQVDTSFQKGMLEHATTVQKQFETIHTPLAQTLKDALSSASSITQNLTGELAEIQRKVLVTLSSGTQASLSSSVAHSLHGLPVVEAPVDPKKEISRFVSENKLEEAFTFALQRSDVSIVSWLCSQVDLHGLCSMTPLPLSQGVLLALLQQLACDVINDTTKKLDWMRDVAATVDPADPTIIVHARPVFEQIYQILLHHRSMPTTSAADAAGMRLILHVINSMLMGCK